MPKTYTLTREDSKKAQSRAHELQNKLRSGEARRSAAAMIAAALIQGRSAIEARQTGSALLEISWPLYELEFGQGNRIRFAGDAEHAKALTQKIEAMLGEHTPEMVASHWLESALAVLTTCQIMLARNVEFPGLPLKMQSLAERNPSAIGELIALINAPESGFSDVDRLRLLEGMTPTNPPSAVARHVAELLERAFRQSNAGAEAIQ
ncbi:hypothetical protein SAMN05421853_103378 [Roseivivax halotolerans]|uniref:Uncharacterized protein n=1 Tax=Roseivivax halotolerans TaxID=93684 RepID=A0A1I5XG34_9RHOB|nr:hypothetical protein [Roseivivax halotolerans]SFQ30942.1 hypothetical protein SAMN05421853_103378 [Roseivivax halotolerans]